MLLSQLRLPGEGRYAQALTQFGGLLGARGVTSDRLIDGVIHQLVDRLSRGEFNPDRSADAGSAGEGGGGDKYVPAGSGSIVYDYEAVPRAIDVEAFRRALTSALTEHVGAAGGDAKRVSGGDLTQRLLSAAPSERQALVEQATRTVPGAELSKLLAEQPTPVVRSRLAGMLERSGF